MQKGKQDQEPDRPGKLSLHAHPRAHIGSRRALGGDQPHSNAQAHRRLNRGALHFYEQRLVARSAEKPGLTRFRNSNRLLVSNGA
jgi:hypothetical protein